MKKDAEHKPTGISGLKSDESKFEERVLKVLAARMEKSQHRTADNHHFFTMSPSEVHQILNPLPGDPISKNMVNVITEGLNGTYPSEEPISTVKKI